MKPSHILLVLLIAAVAGFGGAKLAGKADSLAQQAKAETAYERVMRTGTIRCGYAMWPPAMFMKDANTGQMKGIFYDIIEQMAKRMDLKVEWTAETGWNDYVEGLKSKRFDLFCAPLWRDAKRAKVEAYSIPLMHSATNLYVRKGDDRFSEGFDKLNSPDFTLATMDGEQSQTTANTYFPLAKQVSITAMGDISQLLLMVATGKADGAFVEPSLAKDFADKNPGKIQPARNKPYQVFGNSIAGYMGENDLMRMVDTALQQMLDEGEIDRIVARYEPDRSILMPATKSYTYIPPAPLK